MTQINQKRLVEHFCQLVRIDSESMNEKQIAETLAEQLGELGFTVHKLPVPEHISNGFNVYARLEGKKRRLNPNELSHGYGNAGHWYRADHRRRYHPLERQHHSWR